MNQRIYRLSKQSNLLIVNAAIGNDRQVKKFKLLLDTGSSFTTLNSRLLNATGCDISNREQRIMTAQGTITRSVFIAPWFSCLGQQVARFQIVSNDLPAGTFVDGLLGMDFLTRFNFDIIISVREALIRYRQEE